MIKLTASIVIYNEDPKILKHAIDSFLKLNFEKELIIIDNSPSNTLESMFNTYNKVVTYIFSGKNIGFGSGHNLAFSKFSIISDIHIIINPDIYFDGTEMNAFLTWFKQEPKISLAIPLVLNPDGSTQNIVRNIPTPLSMIKRRLHLNSDEIKIKKNTIKKIPFAHGCFLVFKSSIFKNLKGFDERFFMYMEDVDIFLRAKKYGDTVINTNYIIYHEYRKGSSKNFKLLWWHIISAVKFFRKTYMGSY